MTSTARVLANRRNAAKSTGPRTPDGKAVVAQNAVKHGLLARQAVLKDEDPQEFDLHRIRMLQNLAPAGPEQEMLAERIVAVWWRLKRAERMQDEALDYLIEADRASDWIKHLRSKGDPSAGVELTFGRAVAQDFADARTLDRLSMHERRIESSLYRTMNELRKLKLAGGSGSSSGSEPVCETKPIEAARAACSVPARASREETPCGVTTNGDNDAKQSQSVTAEGGHSPSCEIAKQSQSEEDVSSGAGLVPKAEPPCETKPIEAAGSVCSVPARASREETPCGVTTNGDERAKQSQSVTVEGGHSPSCEIAKQSQSEEEVSSGVDSVPEESALRETKPIEAAGAVCSVPARASEEETPCGVTTNGDNDAKQSQSSRPATAVRTLPRAVRRVAWHYHGVPRSY